MLSNLNKSFPDWAEHSNGIAQYNGKKTSKNSSSHNTDTVFASLDRFLRRRSRLQSAALSEGSHPANQRRMGFASPLESMR